MNAHNTFDAPTAVVPLEFSDFTLDKKGLEVTLPPMSVVVIELEGTVELSPGIDLKNPKPGVMYNYYEGRWDRLPNFDSLSPKRSSVIEKFELPSNNSGEDFAVQYWGYIKVPADGSYTFFLTSDDGADFTIDKSLIVDNDGRHAPAGRIGHGCVESRFS